jgi:branched-chain amino acid transport system ATP-binding protein
VTAISHALQVDPVVPGPLFVATGVSVRFGGLMALDDVHIEVNRGELVGLIGPNGAGKTTFVDAVTGIVEQHTGRIVLDGTDLTNLTPHRRSRAGLQRTWQGADLFRDLTVAENLAVSAQPRLGVRKSRSSTQTDTTQRVHLALAAVGISDLHDAYPDELSGGRQKLVGLARALVGDPKLLLLDEPAAGLDPGETTELASRLREIVGAGGTILLIDHDMSLMFAVCDRVYVLDFGRMVAAGTPAEVRANEEVLAVYLGKRPPTTGPAAT